jgi:hypothetical protein
MQLLKPLMIIHFLSHVRHCFEWSSVKNIFNWYLRKNVCQINYFGTPPNLNLISMSLMKYVIKIYVIDEICHKNAVNQAFNRH